MLADVKKEIRQHGVFWKGIGYPHLTLPTFPVPATVWEKPYWSFETAKSEPDWPMLNIANIWGSQELRWDVSNPRIASLNTFPNQMANIYHSSPDLRLKLA